MEWLTTSGGKNFPSIFKGGTAHGYYVMGSPDSTYNANIYSAWTADTKHEDVGFRTVLYL